MLKRAGKSMGSVRSDGLSPTLAYELPSEDSGLKSQQTQPAQSVSSPLSFEREVSQRALELLTASGEASSEVVLPKRTVKLIQDHRDIPGGMKVLKAIANFFMALWSSITLALTKTDQAWRLYEKYHFLADQTLQGIERTLGKVQERGLYEPGVCQHMQQLIAEGKRNQNWLLPASEASDVEVGEFHLKKAIALLHKAQEASTRDVDCRSLYKDFLSSLREVLEGKAYASNEPAAAGMKALANEISYAMYTQANMTGFCSSLVSHVMADQAEPSPSFASTEKASSSLPSGGSEESSFSASSSEIDVDLREESSSIQERFEQQMGSLHEMHGRIKTADAERKISPATKVGQSLRGEFRGLGFDPHMQGNPPYRKFDVITRDARVIGNLRMSTPTQGKRINPEFKGYLRALAARGERHTYINLQQAHGGNKGENERSKTLHQLAQDPEFSGVLTVVTLDKNSTFYSQKNEFQTLTASQFKDLFCQRLLEPNSGFYIPDSIGELSKQKVQQELRGVLDGIHTRFFQNREDLSVEERQNMIEMAYVIMIDRLVTLSGASFYNNSCKDCIDRGGGENALMYYVLLALQPDAVRDSDIGVLPAMTHADAIWARKREIIEERLERALGAASVILNASEENKAWMRSQMSFSRAEAPPLEQQRLLG